MKCTWVFIQEHSLSVFVYVRHMTAVRSVMNPQVVRLLHMHMSTQTPSGARKNLITKESLGNKAVCVIALGKGLPTISQLSNEQGL